MKHELTRRFLKKTYIKLVIFTIIMSLLSAIGNSVNTIVTNELAMTQMQHSDMAFVVMTTYSKIKPVISIVYSCVVLWFVYTLVRDTRKFAKTINPEHNKEN